MMHNWLASLGHTRTRDVTTRPHLKESRPEIQGSAERKWGTPVEDDLLAPSSFSLKMMRPLNLEKLDVLTLGDMLCLIKNANRVLSICEVILEIKRFVVHSADGIREATPELRDVEDIMDSRKMWG